jgi:hypothetical protein
MKLKKVIVIRVLMVDLGSAERLSSVQSQCCTILGGAMKYLCLVYLEEKKLSGLSRSESETLIEESLAYDSIGS